VPAVPSTAQHHRMTRTLLVVGTASHVGKSTLVAGLCRLLADRGHSVAPFKAQNMSNNARAVVRTAPGGEASDGTGEDARGAGDADGPLHGEIGVSQYVQARAARGTPTTDHNPVLLKPRGDGESQLVVDGRAVGHYEAGAYYREHWDRARAAVVDAHHRLADAHDVIVAEGAGSPAEINLQHRDLANVEAARIADADVLLVGDIERGGVFASLVGTLELAPEDLRERVVGVVVNKFRGDRSILDPGLREFEERTGVPVLGVLPHDDPGLPEEDSVSVPDDGRTTLGENDGVAIERTVTVAVPRLPRVSNFTDLEPLARVSGVRVTYVPPESDLAFADAVVLPGTKNTVDDVLALRDAGFGVELAAFDGPVVGLCGGYQLLGEHLLNAGREGVGDDYAIEGFALLPVETYFTEEKRVAPVTRELDGVGPLAGAEGAVSGYEIHVGRTEPTGHVDRPFPEAQSGAATDRVLGTYLHGLFENRVAREAFVDSVYEHARRERPSEDSVNRADDPLDRAADLVEEHVDLEPLGF